MFIGTKREISQWLRIVEEIDIFSDAHASTWPTFGVVLMMSFPALNIFFLPFLKYIPKNSALFFFFCQPLGCRGFFSFPHLWIPHRLGGLSGTPEFLQGCLRRSFKVLLHVATFPAHQWALQAPKPPWHLGLLLSLDGSPSRFTTCVYLGPAVESSTIWVISCCRGQPDFDLGAANTSLLRLHGCHILDV